MTPEEAVGDRATRLARLVATIDDPDWARDLAPLADGDGDPVAPDAPPTYGDLARAGAELVAVLAAGGRWAEVVEQSRHLRRYFGASGLELGPIAVQPFDGLLAAGLARDAEELDDFVALVEEIFP